MSDYEATAYLSLEKLKVSYNLNKMTNLNRKNICSNFNNSKIKSDKTSELE